MFTFVLAILFPIVSECGYMFRLVLTIVTYF